jgi:GxxExxY protein
MNEPQRHRATEEHQHASLTGQIIGAAIEVHRILGPGLLEPMYESALCIELEACGLKYERQLRTPAFYKNRLLGEYRVDLVIENLVVVEAKCVSAILPVFEAQLMTYMRLTHKRVGLLINFHSKRLKDGIVRRVL